MVGSAMDRQGTLITKEVAWVVVCLLSETSQEAVTEIVQKEEVLEEEGDLVLVLASTQERTTLMDTQREANSMMKAVMDMDDLGVTTRGETTMEVQVAVITDQATTRVRVHHTRTEIVSIEALSLMESTFVINSQKLNLLNP